MGHDKAQTVPQRDLVRLTEVSTAQDEKRHFECSICGYFGSVSAGDAAFRKALERARDAHCPTGEETAVVLRALQSAVQGVAVPRGEGNERNRGGGSLCW
jgi:hypothetical protein